MTRENNPLECGLGKYCDLDKGIDFIGKKALQKINREGRTQEIRGVIFGGDVCPPCSVPWPVMADGLKIGQITSAMYSPRLKTNIGLSMIARSHWDAGTEVTISIGDGSPRVGTISNLPFS